MKKRIGMILLAAGLACLAAETGLAAPVTQEVVFDEGEDRTDRGYNSSMNFWYVGGEVVFHTGELTLDPPEGCENVRLELQVKSPVTDAVDVVVRIHGQDGTEERKADGPAEPGAGNRVAVDLSDLVGKTVSVEMAYAWEQSSLITIVPVTPGAELVYEEAAEEPIEETAEEAGGESAGRSGGFPIGFGILAAAAAGMGWVLRKRKKDLDKSE